MELSSESMESLTLIPSGAKRLTISLHLLGRLRLGITPIGLTCKPRGATVGQGPGVPCGPAGPPGQDKPEPMCREGSS